MAIEEGKAAPAFTLPDQNGERVSLRQFKSDKNVLVYFYPRDDTPGCTKEACGFRDLKKELAKYDTQVLGISADDADSHKKFMKKYKLNFPLLSDANRKVMEKYGAYGEKMMYGKKTVGVIRSSVLIGKNGKVLKHWPKVANAAKHPDKVIEILQESL